jgi:hypothetical protein
MKKIITYAACMLFALIVQAQERPKQEQPAAQFPQAGSYANSKFTYKIINAPEKTFGYDIYADNRLMIHQNSAPGLPGNQGFKTKADAEKVAKLVISKIKKGEMPPTVTKDEMQKLKVIK